MEATKISFTIRRPIPFSRASSSGAESDTSSLKVPRPRHLANDSTPGSPLVQSTNASDSSDEEDDRIQDELVTGFDQFGVQRLREKKPKPEAQSPLVIPALRNRDWRELARKRSRLSAQVKAETGMDMEGVEPKHEDVKAEDAETEDQRAIRALLASANDPLHDGPQLDIAPIPITETDAYRQDVGDLPDEATLDDYARIPVSQFGAALLRGMGWIEGTAASRTRKGLVEPYMPESRPSLLGIGAKEREVVDDGSKRKGNKKPERRYVPVIRKEREGTGTEPVRDDDREHSGSGTSSRRRSRSPRRPDSRHTSTPTSRRNSKSPSRRDRDRERDYDGLDYRSRKGRRDFEGGDRTGRRDTRTSDRDDRERSRSPATNGDSNGRRRRD